MTTASDPAFDVDPDMGRSPAAAPAAVPFDGPDDTTGSYVREERGALRRVAGLSTELADVSEVEYRQLRLERVVLAGLWSEGTLADAETNIQELYDWEFNGPFLKDFAGHLPTGASRDAGAVEFTGD